LRVVKDGQVIHSERVVVGKPDKQTPIFSANLDEVIFHPSWGVPESIKTNDILPSLLRGSTRLLERYNLRVQRGGRDVDPASIDWAATDMRSIHVYQPPGAGNVLGFVKFRFPNKHDVYMHDTPDKHLFSAAVRAFSHGCMRLGEPQRLAELVLGEQGWSAERVAAAIHAANSSQISLPRPIPVHITYFTAVVDPHGNLATFPDIYGHELRIAMGIAGKAHLIPKPASDGHAEVIGQLRESAAARAAEWKSRAFGNN
jgi:murein L,D-transpeptidase YcbB/YkuD